MPESRRSQRRHRHLAKSQSPSSQPRRPGQQQDFATAGEERGSLPDSDRNPRNLSDFQSRPDSKPGQ